MSVTKPKLPSARRFALHPNGAEFASFDEGQLSLGSFDQPSQVHSVLVDPKVVIDMAFSGDGTLLAMGRGQKLGIHVFRVEDLKAAGSLSDVTPVVTFDEPDVQFSMTFARKRDRFVTASQNKIIVWDLFTKRGLFEKRVQPSFTKPATVRAVAISAEGNRLFACIGPDLVEYSLKSLREERRMPEPDATGLAISPQGDRLAIARQTDTIAVINIDDEEPSPEIYRMGNSINNRPRMGWSWDGSMLYGQGSTGLSVWKVDSK